MFHQFLNKRRPRQAVETHSWFKTTDIKRLTFVYWHWNRHSTFFTTSIGESSWCLIKTLKQTSNCVSCSLQCGIAVLFPLPTVATIRCSRHQTMASHWILARIINAGTGAGWFAALQALPSGAIGHVDVVVPGDGVSAIEMAVPDWVSQLDIRHIGDDWFVVRLELRTVPTGCGHFGRAKEFEKYPFELSAEDHVDNEIDAAVNDHQQIADLHHPLRRIRDGLVRVCDHGQDIADQEYDHHAHQHRR